MEVLETFVELSTPAYLDKILSQVKDFVSANMCHKVAHRFFVTLSKRLTSDAQFKILIAGKFYAHP